MKFLRTENGFNYFAFVCEGCQSEGELGVPVEARGQIGCPEDCGASYVQWSNPMEEAPDLMCVVCPIFEEENL